MTLTLTPESPEGQCIRHWLEHMTEHDKGGRAELRRASSVLDAVKCAATHRLLRQLDAIHPGAFDISRFDRLAVSCALMAHIKQPGQLSMPQAMCNRTPGMEHSPVSELRFRRLLDAREEEALLSGIRRILPLVEGRVSPVQLCRDLIFWGEKVKRQWAYDYYRQRDSA